MSTTKAEEYKKRHDPYDPETGATGNDEPATEGSSPGSRQHEDRADKRAELENRDTPR